MGSAAKFAAFWSYARFDDAHEDGRITHLRERLRGEISVQIGEPFEIFQDQKDIKWGELWARRLDGAVDATTFLIPVITPTFFKREACRKELERFLKREEQLGRSDLILPIYYVECRELQDPARRANDPLAEAVHAHQYVDWREFRFEPLTGADVSRKLADMASRIRDVVFELESPPVAPPVVAHTSAGPQAQEPGSQAKEVKSEAAPAQEAKSDPSQASARTEPPTLIVDAMHRGQYATIGAAVAAAKPGTRILVRPGLYREGVVLDKPLELIGDGERGDIVIEATGARVLLFKTTMGRVANLTLRQMGGGKWYGVDVAQGRLQLEECDISSASLACIAVHNDADPRVRRSWIHDGKSGGVLVYENGRGTFEDNDISGNAFSGVEVKDGGDPTFRKNRIHDGKSVGVFVYENGRGTFEDNDISGNALSGVNVGDGGDPTFRKNRIRDGKQSGVLVYENGRGAFEDNDISGNAFAGVEVKDGGDPTFCKNRIHDGKAGGVFVGANGRGTFEDNDISGNAFSGVEVKDGGDPTFRKNRIHDGKSVGVFVYENGRGTFEDNDISGNALSGVNVRDGGDPTFRNNRIRDGRSGGVSVSKNGRGTFEDNDISGNAFAGVEVEDGGDPTVRKNRTTGNGYEAVWIHSGGRGTFESNDLRNNKRGAWDIAEEAKEHVKRSDNVE